MNKIWLKNCAPNKVGLWGVGKIKYVTLLSIINSLFALLQGHSSVKCIYKFIFTALTIV